MWAHCIALLSPDRKNHIALLIISERHHHSAASALRSSKFSHDYQDWCLVGFATAYKQDASTPGQIVSAQLPAPGQIVSIAV